jgi:hypothetical protein
MCSACGATGQAKPLHVRTWTRECGAVHDRDVNAARNILSAGRADRPTPVELVSAAPSGAQSAVKQEPAGMSGADRKSHPPGPGGRQSRSVVSPSRSGACSRSSASSTSAGTSVRVSRLTTTIVRNAIGTVIAAGR